MLPRWMSPSVTLAALVVASSSALAQDAGDAGPGAAAGEKPAVKEAVKPGAKAKAAKKEPRVEVAVTLDDKSDTFEVPARALPLLGRAVAASKRKGKSDEVAFEATITIEQNVRQFTDPAAAIEACRAVGEAMRDLRKVGAGLDDLGEIPDATTSDGENKFDAKKIAAGRAELQKRILRAAGQDGGLRVGRRGNVTLPSAQEIQQQQLRLQQIYERELAKAKEEGLLPANYASPVGSNPQTPEERKAAVIEDVRSNLQETFGRGTTVGNAPAEKATETP